MIRKIKKYILNPNYRFDVNSRLGLYNNWDDEAYLKRKFRLKMGKELDLENPKTFNEKLQWLKIHDRKPIYTTMVDKYEVKKYVADLIGEEYIIPTLGVWERFDDIDFDKLPEQFVLKCTHDSGGLAICRDKSKFDKKAAKKKIERCLKKNFYYQGREWPYKDVKPRIIAEKFLEDEGKLVPEDYKIYCFNGEPYYIVIFHNRFDDSKKLEESVYDISWNKQNISLDNHFAISNRLEPQPPCLDEMLNVCKVLCKSLSQSRIDFYIVEGCIYFGEITLFTASGLQPMIPESLDVQLGDLIELPDIIR